MHNIYGIYIYINIRSYFSLFEGEGHERVPRPAHPPEDAHHRDRLDHGPYIRW